MTFDQFIAAVLNEWAHELLLGTALALFTFFLVSVIVYHFITGLLETIAGLFKSEKTAPTRPRDKNEAE